MNAAGAAAWGLGAAVFQFAAAEAYRLYECRPDLASVFVAYAALHAGRRETWTCTLSCGAALDLLSLDPPGVHLGAAVLVTWIMRRFKRRTVLRSPLVAAVFIACGLVSAALFRTAASAALGIPSHAGALFRASAYGAALALPLCVVLRRFLSPSLGPVFQGARIEAER